MNAKEFAEAVEAANYVILCKKCGEDLGYMFNEKPEVTSHEELTAIIKEWINV